jgi:endonuclease/exonuclease/phosphatase family metal-dependent hydrolase
MKPFLGKPFRDRFFHILISSVLILSAHAQSPVDSTRLIRVLSYNILHGATLNNDFDLDRIAQVISSAAPDIVALQEVDFRTNRAGGMDLATELGLRTGMAPLFGKAMSYDGGEYGEGILSRFTFLKTRCHPLPFSEGNEPRSALEVRIQMPAGDSLAFIGTHLDHTRDQADRIAQAQRINYLFEGNKIPTILAGDLNGTPESQPIRILSEVWTDACKDNPEPTFPSSNPRRRIDYVMFIPEGRWRVVETRVIDEKIASDHCPLLVVLELLPIQ